MSNEPRLVCGARYFLNEQEYQRWYEIRSIGFTEWYVPRRSRWSAANNRHVANCKAAIFPEFFHQVRAEDGTAVGYLATVPGYWSGETESLPDLAYVDEAFRFNDLKMALLTLVYFVLVEMLHLPGMFIPIASKVRESRLTGANAVFLVAVAVAPEYRKHKVPVLLIDAAKEAGRKLGFRYVVAPFRPNAYGKYKSARRAGHSDALFLEYTASRDSEDLPIDPWLRTVVKLGARLLKPVMRSLVLRKPLATFEAFRESFHPEQWYSPGKDSWECGETCSWYVDRARRIAVSVEPNYWGVFDLDPRGA